MKEGARIISSKAFCPLNFHITERNLSGRCILSTLLCVVCYLLYVISYMLFYCIMFSICCDVILFRNSGSKMLLLCHFLHLLVD